MVDIEYTVTNDVTVSANSADASKVILTVNGVNYTVGGADLITAVSACMYE